MEKRVLLIGRNPTVLTQLASALTQEGFFVQTTSQIEQASQNFDATDFSLIAFGRGVDELTNCSLRANFLEQNAQIRFVYGLAPVISLLVKQVKQALTQHPDHKNILADFQYQQELGHLVVRVNVTVACQLTIDLYLLDAVHRTEQQTLVAEFVTAGYHAFSINTTTQANSDIRFLVAEAGNQDFKVLPLQ